MRQPTTAMSGPQTVPVFVVPVAKPERFATSSTPPKISNLTVDESGSTDEHHPLGRYCADNF